MSKKTMVAIRLQEVVRMLFMRVENTKTSSFVVFLILTTTAAGFEPGTAKDDRDYERGD